MTQTIIAENKTATTATIDMHKVDKYILRLLNGEANKLETWLPNLLATGSFVDRETYDYRTSQFRKKEPAVYNTKIALVVVKLEAMRKNKADVISALVEFKLAANDSHEKYKQQRF